MKFRLRIPNLVSSTVDTRLQQYHPVLDGSDVVVRNRWNLPPNTVALIGRRAVFVALDLLRWHWEQDFGGHLFLVVTSADGRDASIVEAGPLHANGTGALVPYAYPEEAFDEDRLIDFAPEVIAPPHGMDGPAFCALVRSVHLAYDGDQRYRAIEIPFLRVGRDSNSYAIGVLLAACIDPRAIPRGPREALHRELLGYPGTEDPVHRGNFGIYPGAPLPLEDGATALAYHTADGDVLAVVIGGEPDDSARLPDDTTVALDRFGRCVLSSAEAQQRGLPQRRTEPPAHLRARRRFPPDPAPQGACITLLRDGVPVALAPGDRHRGTIVRRHDALGTAVLQADDAAWTLPLNELGVELRDPKRVDALVRVGNELTVGLHRDRHPKLDAHGPAAAGDLFSGRRVHLPRQVHVAGAAAIGAATLAAAGLTWWALRRRAR
ncbi:hypothetical protein WPS_06390 [Vulcanimicrobium alpinum]|uniref:Uncharacterized protein n=1 Tax=Vulcanimicrobium alpinum TaxID=3016050 RepID=A0AAN1XW65_UNVUL|nr:hypothetical protein [Vulcanimicrobium alpinum]BDE05363.1 hypothetical protein WPS_06390 [Vulcanimicrobium alpinum]